VHSWRNVHHALQAGRKSQSDWLFRFSNLLNSLRLLAGICLLECAVCYVYDMVADFIRIHIDVLAEDFNKVFGLDYFV